MSLSKLRPKTEMGAQNIRTLLYSHIDRFVQQMKEVLERGWASLTKQAAELHTFHTDQKNRVKEAKGFYKLNEESIASVREDLEADYQALADHHSEEVVQLLEDYGASDLEIARHLHEYEDVRKAT